MKQSMAMGEEWPGWRRSQGRDFVCVWDIFKSPLTPTRARVPSTQWHLLGFYGVGGSKPLSFGAVVSITLRKSFQRTAVTVAEAAPGRGHLHSPASAHARDALCKCGSKQSQSFRAQVYQGEFSEISLPPVLMSPSSRFLIIGKKMAEQGGRSCSGATWGSNWHRRKGWWWLLWGAVGLQRGELGLH